MGLNPRDARLVALGKADLNQLLQKMAEVERASRLQEKHTLNRALAVQIAKGHADLGQVLTRRRMESYLEEHGDRSALTDALQTGGAVGLALLGRRTIQARVVAVAKYEFDVVDAETGTPEHLHKLMVKYTFQPEERKTIRKSQSFDKERSKAVVEPVFRPQDRYRCSDRRLFSYQEARTKLLVSLVEGEQFNGSVSWMSEYEFGLELRGGGIVVIMRHALADIQEPGRP